MRDINVEDFLKLVHAINNHTKAVERNNEAIKQNTDAINRSTNFS